MKRIVVRPQAFSFISISVASVRLVLCVGRWPNGPVAPPEHPNHPFSPIGPHNDHCHNNNNEITDKDGSDSVTTAYKINSSCPPPPRPHWQLIFNHFLCVFCAFSSFFTWFFVVARFFALFDTVSSCLSIRPDSGQVRGAVVRSTSPARHPRHTYLLLRGALIVRQHLRPHRGVKNTSAAASQTKLQMPGRPS